VVADRTMKGVLSSLPARARLLATAADAQEAGWRVLHAEVEAAFGETRKRLLRSLIDGSLVSGEVLARWQEFMADGEFIRRLDGGAPSLADRVSAAIRREHEIVQPLDIPVTAGITSAIRAALHTATDQVLTRWREYPFGATLLDAHGRQATVIDTEVQLERSVRDWRVGVSARIMEAVENTAAGRTGAGVDLQTAADVLFIVALDERSDRRDGASRAAVTVAAAHRVVATFLGEGPVNHLAAQARDDLVARAAEVLDAERRRLERLLTHRGTPGGLGDAIRAAADVVEEAR
jgi:hypothetical protein